MRNRENFEMAMATFGSFGVMKERERENKESREEVKRPRMTTEGGVVPFSATVGETVDNYTPYQILPRTVGGDDRVEFNQNTTRSRNTNNQNNIHRYPI